MSLVTVSSFGSRSDKSTNFCARKEEVEILKTENGTMGLKQTLIVTFALSRIETRQIFSALRASVWSKNKGGGEGGSPGPLPWIRHW